MTIVRVRVHRPSATGNIPAGGALEFTPTRASVIGGVPSTKLLPAPFTVPITAEEHLIDLAPNGAGWAWQVRETFPGTSTSIRVLSVPTVPEGTIVDYTALAQVDPATLTPLADPSAPLWFVYVDALEEEARLAKVNAAGSLAAAQAAQAAATGSQNAASTSAAAAAASQGAAAGSATAAAGSATAAATSATGAAAARTGAETAKSAAETAQGQAAAQVPLAAAQVTLAAGQATAAAGSASAAAASKTGADAARDTAIAHSTGFTAGTVTSLSHTAPPTAAVTGTAPALKLDLGIPRGVPTAITIGEVETGPETPGIVGPQGIQGVKGDPGGIGLATILATSDLNTITTPGLYFQNTSGEGTLSRNYPRQGQSGTLLVTNWGSSTLGATQVFYAGGNSGLTNSARMQWTRSLASGTWTAWQGYASQRIDQTAGRAIYTWDDVNNREQLIYGDTGVRIIPMDNGFNGTLSIRRVLHTVTLYGVVRRPPGGSLNGIFLAALPAGFAPTSGAWTFMPVRHNASMAWFTLYRRSTELMFEGSTGDIDGSECRFEVTWTTSAAWPTTLPGAAAGIIPNA